MLALVDKGIISNPKHGSLSHYISAFPLLTSQS